MAFENRNRCHSELASVYCRYAERRRLGYELLDSTEGHMVVKFSGRGVWQAFRHEAGKHCVQRYPPNEKKGRRHTSIVSVAVLPLPPGLSVQPLAAEDLDVKTQGGTGPGGQHQNKTDSAVRMTHRPTGLQVLINGRDQQRNRREALRILTAKVYQRDRARQAAAYGADRKRQMGDRGRSDKVRTYNFIDSRVVDHRLGRRTRHIKRVMKGELTLLLD